MSPARQTNHHQHGKTGLPPLLLPVCAIIVGLFAGSHFLSQQINRDKDARNGVTHHGHQRIVALSPSIVEILYELGIQDQLVGVSRYSHHPPEARRKPNVGGYLDLNYETLLRLQPDCVLLLEEQSALAEKLAQLGIATITVNHSHTRGIVDSIRVIGHKLGHARKAHELIRSITTRQQGIIASHQAISPAPRVLICLSRDTSAARPENVIIAGSAGYHQELLTMLGASNAYQGPVAFPSLSREKLLGLDPDLIIELVNSETWSQRGEQQLLQPWQAYRELRAVREQRVIIIHGDQHLIPGPRFPLTLQAFARAIHP